MLLFAQFASVASAQDRPPKGKIGMYVIVDTTRAAPGRVTRQVDVEESANDVRKRAKGLDWIKLADRAEDAAMVLTITDRRKDSSKGYVLGYILEAGEYRSTAEFSFEGGTELTGGLRTLGSDSRTNTDGRRTISWDDLAKQFAKSLDGFAKANYDRILRQREQRQR